MCFVNLTTLNTAPYYLVGLPVFAKVIATNAYGDSEPSLIGSGASI